MSSRQGKSCNNVILLNLTGPIFNLAAYMAWLHRGRCHTNLASWRLKHKESLNSVIYLFTQQASWKNVTAFYFQLCFSVSLIIIPSLCLYFHCWGPLLCENCPAKLQPKNGTSLGMLLLLHVCVCVCVHFRPDPNKRFSQKVQGCRLCKSGSHDWGRPGRPGSVP